MTAEEFFKKAFEKGIDVQGVRISAIRSDLSEYDVSCDVISQFDYETSKLTMTSENGTRMDTWNHHVLGTFDIYKVDKRRRLGSVVTVVTIKG